MDDLNEELNIYSEEVKDVLSDPPKAIFRWGNSILLFFIIVIFVLSWIIKYPDVVIAQALLTTQNPPQREYAKITGKIDTLFVSNYQEVDKEDPLALIENTANYRDILHLKSILDTLSIEKDSFYFPLESLPMLFLGEVESDFSLFENSYIEYTLNRESQSFINNDLANKYALSQLKLRLQNLVNQKELNEEELLFKNKDLYRSKTLFEKGVISAQEFENKKLELLQAQKDIKNISVSISQIKENISNASNVKKQGEINNNRDEINLLKAVIQSYDQLKKSIKDWELKYFFKSNIHGKVSFMNVWSKNQTIKSGDLLLTIIPLQHSSYIAKIHAPALNSGKIKVGQEVNIKLSSYPDNEYGVLKGKVKQISLIPNDEGFYLLDVTLPDKLITTYGIEIEFKQEMQGVAEIITEDLRLLERVFYQFTKIFNK